MFEERLISFLNENQNGTMLTNEDIINEINSLSVNREDYGTRLNELIYLLATKRPLITNFIKLDERTAWATYMRENNVKINSMMSNFIKTLGKSGFFINAIVLDLYEKNFANTRFFVHLLNDKKHENKVPYLEICLNSLCKHVLNKFLETHEDIIKLMSLPKEEIRELISSIGKNVGGFKKISGETNTDCIAYSWLEDGFEFDKDFISTAEVGYDLGGGFSTPYISHIFKKNMISLDKNKPSLARENKIKIRLPEEINPNLYYVMLDNQKWEYFDVFENSINDRFQSYFITSFGFATSTVAPSKQIKKLGDKVKNSYTTYYAIKTITDLINKGKDVYFVFYGRPTTKVFQNKIISMKFINKKLINYKFYSDPYSCREEHNFGFNKQVVINDEYNI